MRILVTGSNGFVGSAVARLLTDEGNEVTGIARSGSGVAEGIKTVIADLTSDSALKDVDGGFDAVVHCAGLAHQPHGTPRSLFFEGNVDATRNTARFAVKNSIKRFIHISSISVYGKASYADSADENVECAPVGPYAESKLASEKVCREIFEGSGTKLTILRPATVIGEGDRGNVLKLIKMIDSRIFARVGSGANRKSFIYVKDLAEAVHAVARCGKPEFEVYNVAAEPISVNELVTILSEALDRMILPFRIPYALVEKPIKLLGTVLRSPGIHAFENSLKKWTSEDVVDSKRLSGIYRPRTSAPDALKREAEWYKTAK